MPVILKGAAGFVIPEIFRLAVPILLTCTVRLELEPMGVIGKTSMPGDTVIPGVGRPSPVIVTALAASAGSGSFELMVMPELYPVTATGINLMVIWQDAAGFREAPVQVLAVMLKGTAGPPVTDDMLRGAVPVLVTVMFCVLVVPISFPPKASGEGDTKMFGTSELVPERFTRTDGVSGSFELIVKDED